MTCPLLALISPRSAPCRAGETSEMSFSGKSDVRPPFPYQQTCTSSHKRVQLQQKPLTVDVMTGSPAPIDQETYSVEERPSCPTDVYLTHQSVTPCPVFNMSSSRVHYHTSLPLQRDEG